MDRFMALSDPVAIPSHGTEFVEVPAGAFRMGGVAEDKFVTAVELPQRRVEVKAFALGRAPVTRGEWRAVMGSLPPGSPAGLADDCPVVCVTFPEVMGFLRELGILRGVACRLPSEAEWEYACRAGSSSIFPAGSRLEAGDANFLYDERGDAVGAGRLLPVGGYPANAFGLVDLLGNACEWTADLWHSGYDGAPCDGTAWTSGGKPGCRVIRGGAWDHLPRVLRASWRDWAPEQARWDNLGFRVARTL
jgi:formylglycine-generating enzyme required for sulfatase activity